MDSQTLEGWYLEEIRTAEEKIKKLEAEVSKLSKEREYLQSLVMSSEGILTEVEQALFRRDLLGMPSYFAVQSLRAELTAEVEHMEEGK